MLTFTLRKGAAGYLVREVQGRLGCDTVDGDYGDHTVATVKAFQTSKGLVPDGVAGPKTLAALGVFVELGIDVHGGKGVVDWGKVAAFGVKHASLKCSEGVTFADKLFTHNCNGAKSVGLNVRAYHFARPNNAAALEAQHALQCAGTVPLDLDLEGTGGLDAEALGEWTCEFLAAVEGAQGRVPHMYTNADYWQHRLDATARDTIAAQYRLWIAAPGRAAPQECFPHWDAHQFSWTGEVPGIKGNVDLDWIVRLT